MGIEYYSTLYVAVGVSLIFGTSVFAKLILAECLLSWLQVIQNTCWLLIQNWEQLGAFLSANQSVTLPFL